MQQCRESARTAAFEVTFSGTETSTSGDSEAMSSLRRSNLVTQCPTLVTLQGPCGLFGNKSYVIAYWRRG